jgi:hypothetical protein
LYNKALTQALDQVHESILTSQMDTLDNVSITGNFRPASPMPSTSQKTPGTGMIMLQKQYVTNNLSHESCRSGTENHQ